MVTAVTYPAVFMRPALVRSGEQGHKDFLCPFSPAVIGPGRNLDFCGGSRAFNRFAGHWFPAAKSKPLPLLKRGLFTIAVT